MADLAHYPWVGFAKISNGFFFWLPNQSYKRHCLKESKSTVASFQNDVVSPKIKAQNTKYSQFNSFPKSLKKTMRLFILAPKKKKPCLYFIYIIFILKI